MRVEDTAGAIEPLATLPVFLKLAGRVAVVAGDSAGAAWKANLVLAAGAHTLVYSPTPGEELVALAQARPDLLLERRVWRPADLFGAGVAVLASLNEEEIDAFRAAAHAAGAFVNIIDNAEASDFSFGAIVNRSPLVIGISTDGAAPVFGQAIRARLEAVLPTSLKAWAQAAKIWRARLQPLNLDFSRRRRFWERFADMSLRAGGRGPGDDDFAQLSANEDSNAASQNGEIVLVGAGPGDAELLTLKAVVALQGADVILHDRLAEGALMLARREARRINVGKRAGAPSPSQAEITAMMIALARDGQRVVRLKGGDPAVFGRANDEITAARAAGIKISVIPGVTTALAAAAELQLSLSDRELAPRIQFATAHDGDGETPSDLSWAALAAPDATTAFYMGARKLPALVDRLIAEGLDAETPALYLENVSRSDFVRVRAPLGELPGRVGERARNGPALLLYGRALASGEEP